MTDRKAQRTSGALGVQAQPQTVTSLVHLYFAAHNSQSISRFIACQISTVQSNKSSPNNEKHVFISAQRRHYLYLNHSDRRPEVSVVYARSHFILGKCFIF